MRADYSPNIMTDYVDVPGIPITVTPIFNANCIPTDFATGTTLPDNATYIPKYDSLWQFDTPFSNVFFGFLC